jgi:hypothetical protein
MLPENKGFPVVDRTQMPEDYESAKDGSASASLLVHALIYADLDTAAATPSSPSQTTLRGDDVDSPDMLTTLPFPLSFSRPYPLIFCV